MTVLVVWRPRYHLARMERILQLGVDRDGGADQLVDVTPEDKAVGVEDHDVAEGAVMQPVGEGPVDALHRTGVSGP